MQALVLGTAQFGSGYGITNAKGRLSDGEVAEIIELAIASGVTSVDTAAGYGDAQERLRPWAQHLRITTKVAGADATRIEHAVEQTLRALGVARIDSLLVHDWHDLGQTRADVAATMEALRAGGLVAAVGVSAYEESDLASALEAFERVDIVQVPANALDRRLDASPSIEQLSIDGARIQVRSAFLQGLLAAPSESPQGRHRAVLAFHEICRERAQAPMATALAHVRALPWASEIVVGVTSAAELEQILHAWQAIPPQLLDAELATDDLDLIDPRRWAAAAASVRLQS